MVHERVEVNAVEASWSEAVADELDIRHQVLLRDSIVFPDAAASAKN